MGEQKRINGLVHLERDHDRVAYTQEFYDFFLTHPHEIEITMQLFAEVDKVITEEGGRGSHVKDRRIKREKDGVTITHFSHENEGDRWPDLYKVEIDSKVFFVKRQDYHLGEGYGEITSSAKAKELLKDVPWVDIVPFHLGYTDEKTGRSYFVAEWVDLPRMKEYTEQRTNSATVFPLNVFALYSNFEVHQKISHLKRILKGYFEICRSNMFYDVHRNRIILFDLSDSKPLWKKELESREYSHGQES